MKELSTIGIRVQASPDLLNGHSLISDIDIQLRTHHERLGLIVDYTCPHAEEFIQQVGFSFKILKQRFINLFIHEPILTEKFFETQDYITTSCEARFWRL